MPDMEEKDAKILLVDDDSFLLGIYKKKFELEGFRVTTANNGEAALDEVARRRPHIIMMDVLMPKLDGFATLEVLKSNEHTESIPVVLLTNLGQKEDVEKGMSLGAEDYLIKTHFKPSELVHKVKTILSL